MSGYGSTNVTVSTSGLFKRGTKGDPQHVVIDVDNSGRPKQRITAR